MFPKTGNVWFYEILAPSPGSWSSQAGKTLFYRVRAIDIAGNSVESEERSEYINAVNDAPVITSTAVTTATEDVLYTYDACIICRRR